MIVDDNKVVGVCKQTILSAISKIIAGEDQLILNYIIRIVKNYFLNYRQL